MRDGYSGCGTRGARYLPEPVSADFVHVNDANEDMGPLLKLNFKIELHIMHQFGLSASTRLRLHEWMCRRNLEGFKQPEKQRPRPDEDPAWRFDHNTMSHTTACCLGRGPSLGAPAVRSCLCDSAAIPHAAHRWMAPR